MNEFEDKEKINGIANSVDETELNSVAQNSETSLVEGTQNSTEIESGRKKKKGVKKIPAKKLPRLLKKNYKALRIEKKLFKKIYVTSDRRLLQSLFVENPEKPGYLHIPADKMIDKIDFKRLKRVAKDIKRQRGSFKLVPFAAVVITIFLAYTAVVTFKNPLAKKGITFAMQKVFGARTDIGWVNVEFLKATITIGNLQQANKSSPMKNLFQIDKTEISFNLTEALRGKFDARNIEVSGLAINTDRTYSGELPNSAKSEPNPMVEKLISEVNARKEAAIEAARLSIENAFAEYNPANMIENVKENLKSPAVAQEVQSQVEEAISRWQAKPAEIQKQVEDFSTSTNSFIGDVNTVLVKDFSSMSNPSDVANAVAQVKAMIEQTNALINKSKEMKETVKSLANDVKTDSLKIKTISNQVNDALKSDTALVKKQLDKITSFNLDTGTKILGNAIESAMYAAIGDYYPYIVQATDYAMQLKAKMASNKEEQQKTAWLQPRHERFAGMDIYWKNDNVPRFLIENITFTGLGVAANATQISSDMNKRGAPATLNASYDQSGERTHKAQIVVDARSKTSNPLVGVQYSGDNYPFAFRTPYLNMESTSVLVATGSVDVSGAVEIGAKFNMGTLALTADEFEPAIGYRFYSTALEAIDSLVLGANIGLDSNRHLSLKIDSDLDERFNSILKSVVNKELKVLISEGEKQLVTLLNENCGDVMSKVSQFVDLENGINLQSVDVEKLNKLLESKRGELEAKLKEQTSSAIGDALKNSGVSLPTVPAKTGGSSENSSDAASEGESSSAADNTSKEDAAKNALGGALKQLFKQ